MLKEIEIKKKIEDLILEYPNTKNPKYKKQIQERKLKGEHYLVIEYIDVCEFSSDLAEVLQNDPKVFCKIAEKVFEKHYNPEKKEAFFIRIKTSGEINPTAIREIKVEDIHKLKVIEGIITQRSKPGGEIYERVFKCLKCGNLISINQENLNQQKGPISCGNKKCDGKKFVEEERSKKILDYQMIILQEHPREVKTGEMPCTIDAIVRGNDLRDKLLLGKNVKIVAIVNQTKVKKESKQYKTILNVINISKLEKEREIEVTEEEKKEFEKMARESNIIDKLANSVAPRLAGMKYMKLAALLSFVGGNKIDTPYGIKRRTRIHTLFVKELSTEESGFLSWLQKLGGHYTGGKGIIGAGLTTTVVKEPRTERWELLIGPVVGAHKGVCVIDGLENINKDEISAMQKIMVNGEWLLGGTNFTLSALTTVIASCSLEEERFDLSKKLENQMNLPVLILSAFNLIFLFEDSQNKERKAKNGKYYFSPTELKKWIYLAKLKNPKWTEEATKALEEETVKISSISKREWETLSILTKAVGRLLLKNKIGKKEVKISIKLFEKRLKF